MASPLLARVPLANSAVVFSPLGSLQDAVRVVAALEGVGIEALVKSEGLVHACQQAAPLVRTACGLSNLHVADVADMVSRIVKSLRINSSSQTSLQLEIAATTATTCSCGGSLTCVHAMAVTANVQGLSGPRTVLHVPKRCGRRSTGGPRCRSYHWYNYMVSSKKHMLRGDVCHAPFFFINSREGFDLSYLQMLRLRVCRLHTTFLGEADVAQLHAKLYGSLAPPVRARKLLQQAYFMWNAARSAQEMLLYDDPSADPVMACTRYPFDLAACSESQLSSFWKAYDTHWHRKWCTEHAQHHRRRVCVEISNDLADQLQAQIDTAPSSACIISNALNGLAPGGPEWSELSGICDEHEVPRLTAIIEAVALASTDEDSGQVIAAELVLFMDKVQQQMFVMDGHMKCHRTRCCAMRVRKLDCPGYGSEVHRGCLETPVEGGHFCYEHASLQDAYEHNHGTLK